MIHPRPNVFCLFLILLISCSDVVASIVADETNSGVTVFVAEITSMCGLRWTIFLCLHNRLFHGTPTICAVSYNAVSYMSTAFISGMHTYL